jgi:hypothetical protein
VLELGELREQIIYGLPLAFGLADASVEIGGAQFY